MLPAGTVPALPLERYSLPVVGDLGYEDAVRIVRRVLADAAGNARAFSIRSRGRPRLVSARTWAELAEIEAILSAILEESLLRELRVAPWTLGMRYRTGFAAIGGALRGEDGLVRSLFGRARVQPTAEWRAGAPQLEGTVWPFLEARTEHLANALALALNEPAPFSTLIWHPGRQEFQR